VALAFIGLDFLDGALARKLGQASRLGGTLDDGPERRKARSSASGATKPQTGGGDSGMVNRPSASA
jgi:hypothetical protein